MNEDLFPFSVRWTLQCLTDQVSPSESCGLSAQTPAGGKGSGWSCLSSSIFLGVMMFPLQSAEQRSRLARASQPLGEIFLLAVLAIASLHSSALFPLSLLGMLVGEFWLFGCRLSLLQPVLGTNHPTLSYHLLQGIQHPGTPLADRCLSLPWQRGLSTGT